MGNEFEFGNEEVVNSERSERNAMEAANEAGAGGVGIKAQSGSAKKQMGWKIATGVLALLAVVLGGFLAWRMLVKEVPAECQDPTIGDNVDSDDAAEVLLAQDAQVREIVEAVKEVTAKFMTVTLENEFVGPYQVSLDFYREYDEAFPVYKVDESMPYIRLNKSYGFGLFAPTFQSFFTDQRLLEALGNEEYHAAVENLFASKGFESYALGSEYFNRETGVVCNLPYSGVPTHFACGYVDWYNRDNAGLVKSLGEAYGDIEDTVFGDVEISDSEYKPYQRAAVGLWSVAGIGGANGLFYRTGPEAEWKYFTSLQAVPSCEEFNTEDLRRAFMGMECFDNQGQESTVRP